MNQAKYAGSKRGFRGIGDRYPIGLPVFIVGCPQMHFQIETCFHSVEVSSDEISPHAFARGCFNSSDIIQVTTITVKFQWFFWAISVVF